MHLKSLFPNGSNAFFQANHQIQSAEPKRDQAQSLGKAETRKNQSLERIVLRFKGCYVRPKDPDNFVASLKDIIDGLRRLRLIPDDNPTQIKLEFDQERVATFAE